MSVQQDHLTAIADAIRDQGGATGPIVASDFPAKIRAIPKGGVVPTTPPDPWQVYLSTRPTDWLKLPAAHAEVPSFALASVATQEIQDNEIYLLFHIPDHSAAPIAFTATSAGQYTVEIGTMAGGQFAPDPRFTSTHNSGSLYEATPQAGDFGDVTADGCAQCVIRVSASQILTWEPSVGNFGPTTNPWPIVEMACRADQATRLGVFTSTTARAVRAMRYFTLYGAASITRFSFNGYSGLLAIPALGGAAIRDAQYMFSQCTALLAWPVLDTAQTTTFTNAFAGNTRIDAAQIDTSACTAMNSIFNGCTALRSVTGLNVNKVTATMAAAFTGCASLQRLTFTGGSWATPQPIVLTNCLLMRGALRELFASLPTIQTAQTLTLTGNPGVAELTSEDKLIATAKGWTLAL